jgi:hypothetical protein
LGHRELRRCSILLQQADHCFDVRNIIIRTAALLKSLHDPIDSHGIHRQCAHIDLLSPESQLLVLFRLLVANLPGQVFYVLVSYELDSLSRKCSDIAALLVHQPHKSHVEITPAKISECRTWSRTYVSAYRRT